MPRFVLLHHDCSPGYERPAHWDLMFEVGDALRTWALAQLPRDWAKVRARTLAISPTCPAAADGNVVAAEQLADHRPAYLDYEGPVSGDRGRVWRVVAGTYSLVSDAADCWAATVDAEILRGRIVLRRTSPGGAEWQFDYRPAED